METMKEKEFEPKKEVKNSRERIIIEMERLKIKVKRLEAIVLDQDDQIRELQSIKEHFLNKAESENHDFLSSIEMLEIKNAEYKSKLTSTNAPSLFIN